MGFNIIKIAEAWITAMNPTDEEKVLANKRYEICLGCEYRKIRPITNDEYCSGCGCPISKKIFEKTIGACPEKFWTEVDNEHREILGKNKKTLL